MKYEILNTSAPVKEGKTKWTLFSIDEKGVGNPVIKTLAEIESQDASAQSQLDAVYQLAGKLAVLDPSVKVAEVVVSGEYLAMSAGSSSLVRQAVEKFINS